MTGVMGFLVQCEVCPQRALLTDQVDRWMCPRCIDIPGLIDNLPSPTVDVPQFDPLAIAIRAVTGQLPPPPIFVVVGEHLFHLDSWSLDEPGHVFKTRWVPPYNPPDCSMLSGYIDEVEPLPYKPPTEPVTIPCSARVLADDDEPDFGKIRG